MYTVKKLAERWGVTPQTIYSLVKKDSIPHLRLGPKTIRFTENQVERLENSLDSSLNIPTKTSPPLNNE